MSNKYYYIVKEDVSAGRTDKKYYNNIAVYEKEENAKELLNTLNKLSQGLNHYEIFEEQEEFDKSMQNLYLDKIEKVITDFDKLYNIFVENHNKIVNEVIKLKGE